MRSSDGTVIDTVVGTVHDSEPEVAVELMLQGFACADAPRAATTTRALRRASLRLMFRPSDVGVGQKRERYDLTAIMTLVLPLRLARKCATITLYRRGHY